MLAVVLYKLVLNIKIYIISLAISILFLFFQISFFSYLKNFFGPDYIDNNYVNPTNISLNTVPKNLILIYVEALENTYANPSIFGRDLLANLNTLPGTSFAEYTQVPGTCFTMAAMVSTMCAIPLKAMSLGGSNKSVEEIKDFLPHVQCLGDILKQHGYTNVFLGGAYARFGGKGKFLHSHGYDTVYGLENYTDELPADRYSWGVRDDSLLSKAKQQVAILAAQNKPYNLTILTLDTHHPNGFVSDFCKQQGVQNFADIVKCTDDLIYDFISFLHQHNYLHNTEVVIIGDHLAFDNHTMDRTLTAQSKRTIYNKFILTTPQPKNREQIVHFDILPSVLNVLGFEFADNKLGLGISGFGNIAELESTTRVANMRKQLMNRSAKYVSFWRQ